MALKVQSERISTLFRRERCEFRGYLPHEIGDVLPVAQPLIEKALNRGSEYTIEEVVGGLLAGEMQLWMWGEDAALVTTIQSDADEKVCLMLALGGTGMDTWADYLPVIEEFARHEGATSLRVYGRPGWARRFGFKIDWARMSKCLQDRET